MSAPKPKPRNVAAFIQSALIDDVRALQKLHDAGLPVDARDRGGDTALLCATDFGSRKAFDWLLAYGADPRATNKDGHSPLFNAVCAGEAYMVETLLRLGVDVNAPVGKEPQTLLHCAACFRSRRVAELLIKAGANLNARRPKDGNTPLTLAIRKGNAPLAELLIAAGADVNVPDTAGDTALDLALSGRFLDEGTEKKLEKQLRAAGARHGELAETKLALVEAAKAGDAARVRELIGTGAPADVPDLQGYTPLLYAAEYGHAAAFLALVEAGANWRAVVSELGDSTGALETAAQGGSVEIVQFLLKRGLPVEGHRKRGGPSRRLGGHATPLICAAMSGHAEVVRLLLQAGANIRAKFAGQTALEFARAAGHDDVVAALRRRGAKGSDEDPAVVEVGHFARNAARAAYRKVVQLVTKLCGRPKKWKPQQDRGIRAAGVQCFTLKKASSLATRYGEADEGELVGQLFAEVRQAGFQIILTEMWSDDGSAKLALFPTADPYAVIAAVGTDGVNYGVDTADVIDWLRETAATDPFVLNGCGGDFVTGDFLGPVKDAKALAKRMAAFCPDSLDGDCDTVAKLARALQGAQDFFLWWD